MALLNDSVGTLAGGCYGSEDAKMGIILGTGTNACYVERTANLGALSPEQRAGARAEMLVNTEWGNFTAPSLPISQACPSPVLSLLACSACCTAPPGAFACGLRAECEAIRSPVLCLVAS